MQRLRFDPRPDWETQADSLGFTWRHTGGELYWDETAAYAFTMAEVEDGTLRKGRDRTAATAPWRRCLTSGISGERSESAACRG